MSRIGLVLARSRVPDVQARLTGRTTVARASRKQSLLIREYLGTAPHPNKAKFRVEIAQTTLNSWLFQSANLCASAQTFVGEVRR
jgi:hypothetical protein